MSKDTTEPLSTPTSFCFIDFDQEIFFTKGPVLDVFHSIIQHIFKQDIYLDAFLPAVIRDDQEVGTLSTDDLLAYRNFIRHQGVVRVNARTFTPKTKFGSTCDNGNGTLVIYINRDLLRAVAQLECDARAAPILGAVLATVMHEYAHYLRVKKGLSYTPPTRVVSKFYSQTSLGTEGTRIIGESGYVVETAIFGGVFTMLIPPEVEQDYAHVSASCIETSALWTEEQYLANNGPPLVAYTIENERLWLLLLQMAGQQLEDNVLKLPLISKTNPIDKTKYQNYWRWRWSCDSEANEVKSLYIDGVEYPLASMVILRRDPCDRSAHYRS
ncbi:hypothetical protein K435DRAFT_24465 [Dendrothele bispora CBS 962.96]|uniref:Uncharacterized protein n=1 Tax=Dendrothele bispora (strain CBS 962.96) TaxID=1314807 RepID=A0A4S8MT91_DENBC|nr:hypothetical protein K435DRAFT_24465 [Dendrothele bispora CBS 962.96]